MTGFLIFDGNGVAWRAFYGGRQLPCQDPEHDASLLHNLTTYLLDLSRRFPRLHPVLVFDGGRDLRRRIDPDYKANRPEGDPKRLQFKQQLRVVESAYRAIRANYVRIPGVEADDLISLLATRCRHLDVPAVVATADHDLYQCLGGSVSMLDLREDRVVTAEQVLKEFQGSRERFILWKALAGDSTDNVPGMRGIGAKRAQELVALCRGDWSQLFTARMQRMVGSKWAQVLREPGAKVRFLEQLRLVRTAQTVDDMDWEEGSLLPAQVEAAMKQALSRLSEPMMVEGERWARFCGFGVRFPVPELERLFSVRVMA